MNIFLNKGAKRDLAETGIKELEIIEVVQSALVGETMTEVQDVILVLEIHHARYAITGRKCRTTITISNIISNII